jgi:hypothetical protein
MKAKSAHAKGSRYENYLVEVFKQNIDDKTHRTYGSGNGLDKNDIRLPNFDTEIEAKNATQINLIKDWEQSRRQLTAGNLGVLAIRNPKKAEFQETLIVMDLYDFIELLKRKNETVSVENNFDKNLKWKIKKLKELSWEIFKDLD